MSNAVRVNKEAELTPYTNGYVRNDHAVPRRKTGVVTGFQIRQADRYFLMLLSVGAVAKCFFSSAPSEIIQPVVVLSILAFIPVGLLLKRDVSGIIINPAIIFCGTFLVVYGYSALNSYDATVANLHMEQVMPTALWWACVGLAAFILGYLMPLGGKVSTLLPSFPQYDSDKKIQWFCWASIIIALVRYASFPLGISGLTSFLEGFDLLAVCLIALLGFNGDGPGHGIGSRKWHLPVAVVVASIPGLLSGFRGLFMVPYIMAVLALYFASGRFPWKKVAVFGLFAYLIIFPILGLYKVARQQLGYEVLESVSYTVSELQLVDFYDFSGEQTDKLRDRYAVMPVFTTIVALTGEKVPYQDGSTYTLFLWNFIPRFLWKDKPVLNSFANTLPRQYGIINENDDKTSVGLGLLGETWMNFGYPGLILIMVAFGVIYKCLFHWILIRTKFNRFACAVYLPILWQLSLQENVFVNNMGAIFKFLLLVWLLGHLPLSTQMRKRNV
ncbi:MAG: oligosaccharide repeat unit polymerase [Acidobacteria bacterium]|nr:oligosaccharide repeat unit polymerase [Acidobacteriota bacterium]